MIYSNLGVNFYLLKESDIELVRCWRNDPVVVQNYEYREYITPEMQAAWFKTINNTNNLYTLVEYKGKKVGVINVKNIDWENFDCEGGIFFPDPKTHQTPLPAIVSYITTELLFTAFNWKVVKAHVLRENKSVQAFVKMLGYEKLPNQEHVNNQAFQITHESFMKKAPRLRKAVSVLAGSTKKGVLLIESTEFNDPVVKGWEAIVKASKYIQKTEENSSGRFYYFE
ncbi:MAG: GNAT family N-acetyltransferase [Bacteroidales bacterium]|nr:GNAT family N-acetyltransferase [Bacteroidales bacterium]MDD3665065.1 GNAT family N-acetyltransferase [Bacteroidales bacterium]